MTDFNIGSRTRDITGSKVKQLRREGQVPAVLYGVGDPQKLSSKVAFQPCVLNRAGSNDLIDLQVGNGHHRVLVRDIQRHVTRGDSITRRFYEVDMTQTISAKPLWFSSEPHRLLRKRSLRCHQLPPTQRPDRDVCPLVSEITVDISAWIPLLNHHSWRYLSLPKV